MADLKRRHLRRTALVFLGSLVGHICAFYIAISDFQFWPPPPLESEPAVEVQVVPPPPMPPIIKPKVAPTPKPAPTPPAPQPPPTPTSPAPAAAKPTLVPAPKPAPAPTPLAPPTPAPQPGPPKAVPASSVVQTQMHSVSAPKLVLHKDRNESSPLAPLNVPGAIEAPSTPSAANPPGGGASAAGGQTGGAGFPGGALPGFGSGLRGGLLGCANADALHLSAEERARCAESFGEGTRESPQMNPIDASRRVVLDHEAATEAAADKYKNSTPAGSQATPIPGQPRALTTPGQ